MVTPYTRHEYSLCCVASHAKSLHQAKKKSIPCDEDVFEIAQKASKGIICTINHLMECCLIECYLRESPKITRDIFLTATQSVLETFEFAKVPGSKKDKKAKISNEKQQDRIRQIDSDIELSSLFLNEKDNKTIG